MLPKAVINDINGICISYLWTGSCNDGRPGAVSWTSVSKDKKVGGLWFRDIGMWNMAVVCKLSWQVAQEKDNLWVKWVKWVNCVYIKGAQWHAYEAPTIASWAWKLVCKANNDVSTKLQYTQWMHDTNFDVKKSYLRFRCYAGSVESLRVDEVFHT